jgi:hypothetical protein
MVRCPHCNQEVEETEAVCPHCGRDLRAPVKRRGSPSSPSSPSPSSVTAELAAVAAALKPSSLSPSANRIPKLIALGVLILLVGVVGYRIRQGAGRGGIVGLFMRPQTAQLANVDDLSLAPGAIQRWEWIATARQPTCRLTGQVKVLDGGERDVEVFVLTAANYDSLSKGSMAYAFLQTDRTNAVDLDVTSAEAGRMVFAISNRFSPTTPKVVQLKKIQVVCQ